MSQSKVSVICLCYNQKNFVIEALESVINQSFENIELIIVDDASTDGSQAVIKHWLKSHREVKYIPLQINSGNCAAFNIGWRASAGTFLIDLAADDILLPERVKTGVDCMTRMGDEYGVHFSDAHIIDRDGKLLQDHLTNSFFDNKVPEGYIFNQLLTRYFINPATMMYRRSALDDLNGYDESLAYEDFDFWVRSSKKFKYCYTNEILVSKRVLRSSHSKKQYKPGSKLIASTYTVCEKAFNLCASSEDYEALAVRIKYELKMSLFSLNLLVATKFYNLRNRVKSKLNSVEF